ncbi:Dolichyl-phosphate-mannose-protein mannosyltransferase-domain-containing protein [Spinellus fusiger]|nr:Dolichyl-phosphate-mannose-protein mannosyltransferase-domain-containing protein [Spinellus fusiger]
MESLKRRHSINKDSSHSLALSPPPPPYTEIHDPASFYHGLDHSDIDLKKEKRISSNNTLAEAYPPEKYFNILKRYQNTITTIILTLLSLFTRFYNIAHSNIVIWDEAHFGRFGSYYIKNEFYFDVHPPLGKMLVGLSGWIVNYNGTFAFDSGSEYPPQVNFQFMRIFNASWGAFLVPLAYMTALQFKMSQRASLLAATMVLADVAYLCISRFILLDSMLLFFTCTTLFTMSAFNNYQDRPFSRPWWTWMFFIGLSLGCVLSIKWVGLFSVALVGLYTVGDLWDMLGDLKMPKKIYFGHWVARILCLVFLPLAVYVACFKVHFMLLTKSGPGDSHMSSLFQAQLEGNPFSENPLLVAFGSNITIKNVAYGGALLHSHPHLYPEGSKQQQITCYHYKDANNEWTISEPHEDSLEQEEFLSEEESDGPKYLKDGDIIRLSHINTRRNLHTHPIPAPITNDQWEVSGYGNETLGDIHDHWKIEIVNDEVFRNKTHLHSLSTQFRLRNVYLDCLLASHTALLPQWGYKQLEVYCDRRNQTQDVNTWWNIEEHENYQLPPSPKNTYKSKFISNFIQLNIAMWRSNNALTPNPDKEDVLTSSPFEWPFASTGLRMCGWADQHIKFYLLGNPIVWWSSGASILGFALLYTFYSIRLKRGLEKPSQVEPFLFVGKMLFLGWFLHYFPFFLMGRVTYLHHYFPCLYFSMLLFPCLLDHFTAHYSNLSRNVIFGGFFSIIIATFIYFLPLAYGMTGPITDYSGRLWMSRWNLLDTF